MSDRIYIKVCEQGKKRPVLEFQALSWEEVVREFCLWFSRRYPNIFEKYSLSSKSKFSVDEGKKKGVMKHA